MNDRSARPVSESGLLLVFFDAPDTPETTDWLFGAHAREVIAKVPGVERSRTFRILNPAQPGQHQWLTILESHDIGSTWRHRALDDAGVGQVEATKHGVSRRHEYYVRTLNDVSG